ncbi:MAG TPA: hypothetical protein DGG94_22320 [Micromonosporaceae bacterium]|nr:hypothetical protein [Micromonosporaceae bacterium]
MKKVANPWGIVPMMGGGQSVSPRVREYMDRVWEESKKRDCLSRRHHYVPQAHLRAWSPDGKRVRALHTANGTDKLLGLRDVCVKENYYQVTDSSDVLHNQVEAMLAVIDGETAHLLRRLNQWSPGDDIAVEEFMSLAAVMAFQRNRTPQARRFLTEMSSWQERRVNQPAVEYPNDVFVDVLFRTTYGEADEFPTRQLELWDDPKGRFITCDQPILLSPGAGGTPPSTLHSR